MLRTLIRTAAGKGGGRNTETEATARAWHEGLQKLRLFIYIYAVIKEDDSMEGHFPFETTVNQARELRHLQCWSSN